MTAIGELANTPVSSLKIKRAAQFGARAQAIVKMVKKKNVDIMIYFLPKCSDMGPKSNGPSTYPTRYIEIGRMEA